jgi:DNA topoisomerase-1
VSVGRGQFGPYVKYGARYASIKEDDPFTLTLERALEIVAAKEKADAQRRIQVFEDEGISVLDGRFGPYVTDGKKNAKVPKPATITRDTDADTKARLWRAAAAKLSLDECRELIAAAPEAKGRFGRRAAAAKKKSVTTADKPKQAKAPRKTAARKKAPARKKGKTK